MESFEEIRVASANNPFSFLYWAILLAGVCLIVACAFIQGGWRRWTMYCVAIIALTIMATCISSVSITEKWRIRGEWVIDHYDELTPQQQQIAIADGANLVLGPLLFGFLAFLVFVFSISAAATIRWISPLSGHGLFKCRSSHES